MTDMKGKGINMTEHRTQEEPKEDTEVEAGADLVDTPVLLQIILKGIINTVGLDLIHAAVKGKYLEKTASQSNNSIRLTSTILTMNLLSSSPNLQNTNSDHILL